MPRRSGVRQALPLDRLANGVHVIPIRALPFVAPAVFAPGVVVRALAEPHRYYDVTQTVLVASVLVPALGLQACAESEFSRALHDLDVLGADACSTEIYEVIPAGLVVRYESAKTFHKRLIADPQRGWWTEADDFEWNDAPAMLPRDWDYVFESFPASFIQQRGPYRRNNAERHLANFERHVEELFARAASANTFLDRESLPPTKENFVKALSRLQLELPLPALGAEMRDLYFRRLGLRFRKGRVPAVDPWLEIVPARVPPPR